MVGTSGNVSERVAVVTASARTLPALMCLDRRGQGAEHHLHLAADQIGQRGRAAAIGHVQHIDAGHHLEQFAGDMDAVPVPPDAMLILPGLAFA